MPTKRFTKFLKIWVQFRVGTIQRLPDFLEMNIHSRLGIFWGGYPTNLLLSDSNIGKMTIFKEYQKHFAFWW